MSSTAERFGVMSNQTIDCVIDWLRSRVSLSEMATRTLHRYEAERARRRRA